MCGIIGYICSNHIASDTEKWLEKGLAHQYHRGPDGKGITETNHEDKRIVFGHNRLSIIDLSENGKQPIVYRHLMMTFNGEIYNYKKLATYLTANDDLGQTIQRNDAHTLIRYIAKYGLKKALQDVSGMFAFALYDSQEKQLHLVADHFNQKPLYYYKNDDLIAFASTPATLYGLQDKWQFNHHALRTYWMLGGIIGSDQLLIGIKKVTAGELVTYDLKSGRTIIEKWYQIKPKPTKDIEQLIYEAINETKVADVPVYIYLSGGIDSSIVASRFVGGNAIHLASPEKEYAQEVAGHYNINLIEINPSQFNIYDVLQDYVTKSGEPTMAGSIPWITAYEVSKHTKCAVIANGADELFFGYDRLRNDEDESSVAQNNHLFRGSLFTHKELNTLRKQTSRQTELDIFIQYDLNRTLDFASMCHGLEVRSPFLNHKLVEAALSIPEQKHRQNGNKSILKAILHKEGFSHGFTERPKLGFSLHTKPEGMDQALSDALQWATYEGWLDGIVKLQWTSQRDKNYISNAALGFYVWHKTYSKIIA